MRFEPSCNPMGSPFSASAGGAKASTASVTSRTRIRYVLYPALGLLLQLSLAFFSAQMAWAEDDFSYTVTANAKPAWSLDDLAHSLDGAPGGIQRSAPLAAPFTVFEEVPLQSASQSYKHPAFYALSSMYFPGQGQADLGQTDMAFYIRAGMLAALAGALWSNEARNQNYRLADAALTQSDQDLYYQNAMNAYLLNQTLLWLTAGVYVFNIWNAWSEADTLVGLRASMGEDFRLAYRWDLNP